MIKTTDFVAPMSGKILDISDVPDVVFSDRIMGDGFAIDIMGSEIVSPVDGTIDSIFPGGHAVCIVANNGMQILIHIGLETHGLNNIYKIIVNKGQKVEQGQLLIKANYREIQSKGKSGISPIVFLNKETVKLLKVNQKVKVKENYIVEVTINGI